VASAWEALGICGGFDYVATRQNLVASIRRQGRAAEAEPIASEQRSIATSSLPKDHWLIGVVAKEHGACLRELGQRDEAESALLEAHGLLVRVVGAGDFRTQRVVDELVALYEAWPRHQEAEQWKARQVPVKQ
jgi:hypothetical protein